LVRFLLAELMIGTVSQRWVSLTARTGFSLLLAELMIGTLQGARQRCAILQFQSPISGVNDWNGYEFVPAPNILPLFQSPISGVNDWN